MKQADLNLLAHQFMLNAVKVERGQNIWIEYCGDDAKKLADLCAEKVLEIDANPFMVDAGSGFINNTIGAMSPQEIEQWGIDNLAKMRTMQGYIRIRDEENLGHIAISNTVKEDYKKANRLVTDYRVNNTRWLLVSMPNSYFAQRCKMALTEFEEFYKKACLVNYDEMSKASDPLVKLLAEGKKVRLYSPAQDTDLTFSIENIPAVPCVGKRNIPDGEVYTAPVRNSVNGTITFTKPSYEGESFEYAKLTVKNGRIEKAEAENDERTAVLNHILDADTNAGGGDGSRYFGEFAINFHPHILHPVGITLFDEKIAGGIHLAAGNCYDLAPNGNFSVNHWDMVHIQRPEYGGGEIWMDDVLIRKDGLFVCKDLLNLNPEELKKHDIRPDTLSL